MTTIRYLLATHVHTDGGIGVVHTLDPVTRIDRGENLAEYDRGAFTAPERYLLDRLGVTTRLDTHVWFQRVLVPEGVDPVAYVGEQGDTVVRRILADASRHLDDEMRRLRDLRQTLGARHVAYAEMHDRDPFATCPWCAGCGTDTALQMPCPDCAGTGLVGGTDTDALMDAFFSRQPDAF